MLGWVALVAISIFFLVEAALPYFTWSETTYRRFWPNAPWLLAHVIGGSIALLLGPVQFWIALRKPLRTAHRWTGRLYLAGVLLAGASGFYLAFHAPLIAFGAGLLALDVAWLASTAIAYAAIRKRRVPMHREWMIRSYVMTLVFVTFRLWLLFAMSLELGDPTVVIPVVGWASWIVPVIVLEVLLRRARRTKHHGDTAITVRAAAA